MEYNPFVEQRKRMKQQLYRMIQENPDLEHEKIVALFCLKTGLRESTAMQYLREIEAVFDIEIERQAKLPSTKGG